MRRTSRGSSPICTIHSESLLDVVLVSFLDLRPSRRARAPSNQYASIVKKIARGSSRVKGMKGRSVRTTKAIKDLLNALGFPPAAARLLAILRCCF